MEIKKRLIRTMLCAMALAATAQAQIHKTIVLRDGWTFSKDGGTFNAVTLPHDWAISGKFDKNNDVWRSESFVDGKKVINESTGNTGALPWTGKGEYRTKFKVARPYSHAELLFDGAMAEPEVYINGKLAGQWKNGYNAFRVDATPYLKNGENNVVVKLNNPGLSSRWYPGGGIYRPVKLILTGKDAIDTWGVWVTTPEVSENMATVNAEVALRSGSNGNLDAEITILSRDGKEISSANAAFTAGKLNAQLKIPNPALWTPETPSLYTLRTRLKRAGKVVDENLTRFGVRSISFTKENGFQLNGKTRKFKGVCLHHDLGPLGAAVNEAAIARQIRIMKDMGCDAIRTSHNMPSTMMMDLCDSLGILVMAESFDSWMTGKTTNAYSRFFKDWAEKDLINEYYNHRNHPSIVMWSIGNEIPDQKTKEGAEACRRLVDLLHKLDPTRPVTAGVDDVEGATRSGFFNSLDVPGFNYHTHCYETFIDSLPQGFLIASETASTQFKQSGSTVKLVKLPVDEATGLPKYKEALDLMIAVADGIKNGTVLAAGVVKEGGSASAVCRMAFGNKTGFTFAQNLDSKDLFAPLQGSFVLELADENAFDGVVLGTTNDNSVFIIDGTVYTCDDLIEAWTGKLEKVFPTDSGKQAKMYEDVPLYKERSIFVAKNKVAKPRVFIPAFPGTNCEVDSARAFEKAGADVSVLVVNNLSSAAINETIDKMAKEIEQSQIIMLPGGFSGGDEPEGSGKFIATTFRNPKISEAVQKLLNCRDGLMLGICNGFQALIKLGLVPYGEIKTINEDDPTLTFNTIGRHISSMAYTRVTSVKSPWLSGVNAGDMFAVPISHGEGRFVANEDVMKKLIENGQVATQYVNLDGEVVADMPFNPNGSVCAVEGITSPDGRVLGKMGHCERKGDNLYKNVPFEKDMLLFESGVKYFK